MSASNTLFPLSRTPSRPTGMVSWLFPVPTRDGPVGCTVTTYPPGLLVVTRISTAPFALTEVSGGPLSVNDGVRPDRVIDRASMVVDVTQPPFGLAAGQLLPSESETTRLSSTEGSAT